MCHDDDDDNFLRFRFRFQGCFVSIFCNCCASYALRKRTLYDDMSRYICCGGHCPCSGKMNEESCPELCLCLETVCCFAQSVASTRFMIQDEMHLENTQCDNCLVVRLDCDKEYTQTEGCRLYGRCIVRYDGSSIE